MIAKLKLRCAVYTRKSTEEGLEQEFNSLDAQREACEAYIASQKPEGWVLLEEKFDDGGHSGGTLERPALQQLLQYIEYGRIDVVLVYKIDRLSRSLMDFAKLVEVFDRRNVTFVSVTQSFNTTTSMGRLTLNVLLSFAQFEREVISERIRDKFAASKKRGMWMGGNPPLGYDIASRKLMVNSAEAKIVNLIFKRYLDLGCVRTLRIDLEAKGVVSKIWTSEKGHNHGGQPFDRGALYCLLKNRVYLGETTHKDNIYPGEHSAIVPRELFEAVQVRLASGRHQRRSKQNTSGVHALTGLIFDDRGNKMIPTYSRKSNGHEYRYYASSPTITGKRSAAGSIARIPAQAIEGLVEQSMRRLWLAEATPGAGDARTRDHRKDAMPAAEHLNCLRRIEILAQSIALHLDRTMTLVIWRKRWDRSSLSDEELLTRHSAQLGPSETLVAQHDELIFMLPIRAVFRGGRTHFLSASSQLASETTRTDAVLIKALARAHTWLTLLADGTVTSVEDLAVRVSQDRGYVTRVLRLAFLSPEITRSILAGRQRPGLSLRELLDTEIPLSWSEQSRGLAL